MEWSNTQACWNCHNLVTGKIEDVKAFRDYYDEGYYALVCPKCSAHSTIKNEQIPSGYWWDTREKKLRK